jgi:hypothetical protein
MKFHGHSTLALASAGLALALGAAAVQAADLPAERRAGSVSYVTGGVSDEEASTFKAMRGGYPLSIELVQKQVGRNEFTADANVKVIDMSGNVVLDAKADGPFMLVRVPPGQYRVQATLNGRMVESKPVQVGASGSAQAMLAFPAKTD